MHHHHRMVCFTWLLGMLLPLCACFGVETDQSSGILLLDLYQDDFSGEKAGHDSYLRSRFWVHGAQGPNEPYLTRVGLGNDGNLGLMFHGGSLGVAQLGYRIPVLPDSRISPYLMKAQIKVRVHLLTSDDPWHPKAGHLVYQSSPDGQNWSRPRGMKPGLNQVDISLENGVEYIRFQGDLVVIDDLQIRLTTAWSLHVPMNYNTLQAAIDHAQDGDVIAVAPNRYAGEGNTNLDFLGKNICLISESGPATCIIDCAGDSRGVIMRSGETRNTALVGFTITGGVAVQGAGIYIEDSSPTIMNCIVTQCECVAESGGLARGGGIYCQGGAPLFSACQIVSNRVVSDGAGSQGGGVYLTQTGAVFEQCRIVENSSQEPFAQGTGGGGVFLAVKAEAFDVYPVFRNTLVANNHATGAGGGLYSDQVRLHIFNCTFADNQTEGLGGACFLKDAYHNRETTQINSSILWGNQPDEISFAAHFDISPRLTFCTIQGGWQGSGSDNDAQNPYFAGPNGDYALSSRAGRWDAYSRTWIHDVGTSLCVDAGDPSLSFAPEYATHGGRINRGAYGGTAAASKGFGTRVYHVDVRSGDDGNSGMRREGAFATIQQAVDLARDRDAVLVWPGHYRENVVIQSKSILLQSAADAAVVSALGEYAFTISQVGGAGMILRNFVICDSLEAGVLCNIASPVLEHLTIVGNGNGIIAFENPEVHVSNCILWGNTLDDLVGCRATYSCIQHTDGGQIEGTGNISRQPHFVDPNGDDYHLQSPFGRYWPEHEVWVVDDYLSPCIDRANFEPYPQQELQKNGSRLNMGAYGGTAYASRSPHSGSADLNSDGIVDFLDFAILADRWLESF